MLQLPGCRPGTHGGSPVFWAKMVVLVEIGGGIFARVSTQFSTSPVILPCWSASQDWARGGLDGGNDQEDARAIGVRQRLRSRVRRRGRVAWWLPWKVPAHRSQRRRGGGGHHRSSRWQLRAGAYLQISDRTLPMGVSARLLAR